MRNDFIAEGARIFSERAALHDLRRNCSWNYQELFKAIERVQVRLHREGIKEGSVLSTYGGSSVGHLILLLACLREGVVINPLNTRFPLEQARRLAEFAGGVLVEEEELLSCESGGNCLLRKGISNGVKEKSRTIPDNIATLLFSSGSSGFPKLVAHSLEAHLAAAQASQKRIPIGEHSVWLLNLPLFHVSGLSIVFRCLLNGACVAIATGSGSILDNLKYAKVSHLSVVGTQLKRILKMREQPPKAVQAVLCGGGPIDGDLVRNAVEQGWPLHLTYGMTETASQITTSDCLLKIGVEYSCGRALRGYEVAVGLGGEIMVRTPSLFKGYLQEDGSLNSESITGGWFSTGDVGFLSETGNLSLVGRRDRMFISGGENIYPEMIERVIESCKGIQRAAVLPIDDEEFGKRPVAFVCEEPSVSLSYDLIREKLRAALPEYCVPIRFMKWPEEIDPEHNKISLEVLSKKLKGLA